MLVIRFQTVDSVRKDGEHIDEDAGSNKSKVMIISWPSNKTFDLSIAFIFSILRVYVCFISFIWRIKELFSNWIAKTGNCL